MKIWKLVSGILSMVLFGFVMFQSCAAGVANSLSENGEVSGSAGVILAIFMLAGGIVSVATHKKDGIGGDVADTVLFLIAAFFGFVLAGSFSDLRIWAGWCLVCAIVAIVNIILKKKKG